LLRGIESDVQERCPAVGIDLIRRILRQEREADRLECLAGRYRILRYHEIEIEGGYSDQWMHPASTEALTPAVDQFRHIQRVLPGVTVLNRTWDVPSGYFSIMSLDFSLYFPASQISPFASLWSLRIVSSESGSFSACS
jgi:hypothetical protein